MQLKYRIENGLVVMFAVVISGYNSKQVLQDLMNKIWLYNRWQGRFYFSIIERCHKFVIEVQSINKRDELSRNEFVRQIIMRLPKNKNIFIT